MNRQEHILTIVAEECAEIAQRASKALRFGLDEIEPGEDDDNFERMLAEFADLCGVLELVRPGASIEGMTKALRPKINAKKDRVESFLSYSKERGTLS